MEELIRDRILDHLKKDKLVQGSQHGFTCGQSRLTNLMSCLEALVTQYLDQGNSTGVRYPE